MNKKKHVNFVKKKVRVLFYDTTDSIVFNLILMPFVSKNKDRFGKDRKKYI